MGTALVYLLVMVAVAAALFLLASWVFGRGEELAPLPAGHTATVLPAHGVAGADVRALRFQQVVRGYKADEVDWVLEQLAVEIDNLRAQPRPSTAQPRPSTAQPRPSTAQPRPSTAQPGPSTAVGEE